MQQNDESLLRRLNKPSGIVDAVIDTDTWNEVDDQYALSFLIKSDEKIRLKAIYAAPFLNRKSSSPADGMEKSYDEILHIISLLERDYLKSIVKKGSRTFLPSETEPVDSPAARDLAERAMNYSPDNPLYIIAIRAITNIASALLINSEILNRIVIVWLGGHAHFWPDTKEFNMMQDVAAARIILGCGVALVQLPCMGVVSAFTVSGPELEYWLKGKNKLCDYLVQYTVESAIKDGGLPNWTRVIWDVTTVGWLLNNNYMQDYLVPSPIPQYDHHYGFDPNRHFIRYVYHIERDRLFKALFECLAK
ncbi:MAG: nucleoside hydrolase [Bacteroidetes bacterium]|nr:nucleoside hydrolase [Bacteroidota bacterium]